MIRLALRKTLWMALLLGAACDEAPAPKPLSGFGDAGIESDAEAVGAGPRYAVLSSDWSASSVSLLAADGEPLAEDYINSGSVQAGLVTALSGDVDLPTSSGEPGVLVLIDRYKSDVITRIRLADGEVLGQVKTHTPPTQATDNAFSSNPHDYVYIDAHSAWVTRNQPNLDPDVAEIDRGNDLLRIDPSTMERSDERIDLSLLDTVATRTNFDTGEEEEVAVYARPSRMARVGETLVVGLGLSAFDFSAFGPGAVAVVDPATREVQSLPLEGLYGCTKVAPIPGEQERVLVTCGGGEYGKTREQAGFAIVRVRAGEASVEQLWRAQDHAELPALSEASAALGGTLIVAAANQFSGDAPSVFGVLDLASSEFTELLSLPAAPGGFGTPVYDADARLLLVPDGSTDADQRPTGGLYTFRRAGEDFEQGELRRVAEDTALPVRNVYRL